MITEENPEFVEVAKEMTFVVLANVVADETWLFAQTWTDALNLKS